MCYFVTLVIQEASPSCDIKSIVLAYEQVYNRFKECGGWEDVYLNCCNPDCKYLNEQLIANSNLDPTDIVIHRATFKCPTCKYAKYCNAECQLAHLKQHAIICQVLSE